MVQIITHDFWHLLMNCGMILIFSLITFRGIRALHGYKGNKPVILFLLIFALGVIGGGIAQWGWWAATNAQTATALGASGGASALFATGGWAMGGRHQLIGFGCAWIIINALMVMGEAVMGPIAWAAHMGGFVMGALLAPYWVKPSSA